MWCAIHRQGLNTMRTNCAISDSFVRDCVFTYFASVAQYVYSLSAEYFFRLRKNAISDERVRDCALCTHCVARPLADNASTTNKLRHRAAGRHIPELYYTSGTSIWLALWLVNFSQSEAEDSLWLSRTGERYVQLLSVAHGGRGSVTNVVWGSVCYVHLLSVAKYGGHRSVMRSDKSPRSVSRLTLCYV